MNEALLVETTRLAIRLEAGRKQYANVIPGLTLNGIYRYVIRRIPPGAFLAAVFADRLFDAVGHADSGNRNALDSICEFVWNYCPADCWGSPEKVGRWLAGREGEVDS